MKDWDSEVADVYLPEVDRLLRERLLPGRRIEIGAAPLLRRGRGTATPFYATGVHSDGGLGLDDHLHNIEAFAGEEAGRRWRERYARDDVEGLMWLNVWRPTNMAGPLDHIDLPPAGPSVIMGVPGVHS